MATVYKVEIVSHWINYRPKDLEKIIQKAIEDKEENDVTVRVERKH